MKQPFLLEFLRTYPTKRIAKKLLQREAVILIDAERVSTDSLVSVLDHVRKLAFDPLIVVPAEHRNSMRETVQDCLLRSEQLAGETKLPIYNQDIYRNGIVPCIRSTDIGWESGSTIDKIKDLVEYHNVTKIYRFKDNDDTGDSKQFVEIESDDTLTNLLLNDDKFKSTIVDIPLKSPNELFRHCTNGKLTSGVEYRRGISVVENKFNGNNLKDLLEHSFKRQFKNWDQYEKELNNSSVYVAGNYFGTAIVYDISKEVSYLDKFAVNVNQQSSGVAELLWNHLKSNHKTLAWRSRADNPANNWYLSRSDGSFSLNKKWKLFWYGDLQLSYIGALQKLIDDIPSTFSENFSK
eukprot:NODE_976_length_2646_cov_0.144876.p1 type:complete len:351 gc:universal NODE_976_length_2646_cov_0.144876:167-1219(+)